MSEQDFVLAPFPGLACPPGVQLTGTARRAGGMLQLEWRLADPGEMIDIPAQATLPERRRDLWEQTCFEFFLALEPETPVSEPAARPGEGDKPAARPGYWEFNLAPTGHWNVFHFDAYRAGMNEEPAFEALPFSVAHRPGLCQVSACIDLTKLGSAAAHWRLAVAMVLTEPAGRTSFWALSHPDAEPDFHHAGAFLIRLSGTATLPQ
jgi:hypothetical protein